MSKPRKKKKSWREQLAKATKLRQLRRSPDAMHSPVDPYEEALAEWEAGDQHAALDALERLHGEFPERRDVLTALTRWTHELKQYDEEVEYCQKLVKLAPASPEVWYYLGTAHWKTGNPRWPGARFSMP